MRLTDLEPRWLLQDGRRVGFIFRCPLPNRRDKCWQSCFENPPERREQWRLFAEAFGETDGFPKRDVQGCRQGAHWAVAGGLDSANFDTMTVTPSLDGSAGGNWHGFITNGEIVGGL